MSIGCLQRNIAELDADISARWGGLPVVMGGDHNRKTWPQPATDQDWTKSRTEPDTAEWHDSVTSKGYSDVIRATYSSTADENGDGNIDMCEQYTSGIHPDHPEISDQCAHRKHGRIDYIWTRNVEALVYAMTDQAYNRSPQSGNYYSDHRPVFARISY